jgi:hypothetical protein
MKRNNKGQYMKIPVEDRFHKFVEKDKNGCWNWTGKTRKDGYGTIVYNGKETRAHRVSLILKGYVLNRSIKVCHNCDNPKCVNPDHLFLGTQKDNIKDMFKKHRNSAYFDKGVKNPNAKLTQEQVNEIRNKYIPYKYSTNRLAKEYGLCQQNIWKIINHKRYG